MPPLGTKSSAMTTPVSARPTPNRRPATIIGTDAGSATFHSTSVQPLGEDHLRVSGDLTIRGVTKPVTLDVNIEGKGKDMQGQDRYGFIATTSFSRKEFGLEWNVALESGGWLVSDKINIAIDAQVVAPAETPAATR